MTIAADKRGARFHKTLIADCRSDNSQIVAHRVTLGSVALFVSCQPVSACPLHNELKSLPWLGRLLSAALLSRFLPKPLKSTDNQEDNDKNEQAKYSIRGTGMHLFRGLPNKEYVLQ